MWHNIMEGVGWMVGAGIVVVVGITVVLILNTIFDRK